MAILVEQYMAPDFDGQNALVAAAVIDQIHQVLADLPTLSLVPDAQVGDRYLLTAPYFRLLREAQGELTTYSFQAIHQPASPSLGRSAVGMATKLVMWDAQTPLALYVSRGTLEDTTDRVGLASSDALTEQLLSMRRDASSSSREFDEGQIVRAEVHDPEPGFAQMFLYERLGTLASAVLELGSDRWIDRTQVQRRLLAGNGYMPPDGSLLGISERALAAKPFDLY